MSVNLKMSLNFAHLKSLTICFEIQLQKQKITIGNLFTMPKG